MTPIIKGGFRVFGGTAKTYANWQLVGEPFKEDKKFYINVIKPGTTTKKKVRWYVDKAHADLMPDSNEQKKPLYALFGFENENDYILCIRMIDLTAEEERTFFHYNWKRGGRWVKSNFFGEVWYAPKDEIIPPIAKADKVFRVTWEQFKKEGQKNSKSLNINTSKWWFN